MIKQDNSLKSLRTGSQMNGSDFSMQCPLGLAGKPAFWEQYSSFKPEKGNMIEIMYERPLDLPAKKPGWHSLGASAELWMIVFLNHDACQS